MEKMSMDGKSVYNTYPRLGERVLSILMALILTGFCAGCGKTGVSAPEEGVGSQVSEQQEEDAGPKWTYIPETLDMDETQWMTDSHMYYDISHTKLVGDYLYYTIGNEWDEEEERSGYRFYRYHILDGSSERLTGIIHGKGESLSRYDISGDGSICGVEISTIPVNGSKKMYLEKYDTEGGEVYSVDLTEALDLSDIGEIGNVVGIFCESDDRVCLVCSKKLFLFDGEGNCVNSMDACQDGRDAEIRSAGRGDSGKIYVFRVLQNASKIQHFLQEVDFDNRMLCTVDESFFNSGYISSGIRQELMMTDATDSTVYDYDPDSQTKEKLFSWGDYGLEGILVISMGVISDGRIVAALLDYETGEGKVLLFARAMTEKEELVLGTVRRDSVLRDMVSKFNRTSDKYHITVRDYTDGQEWSAELREEAWTKLNLELVSGNGPDIIDLRTDEMQAFAKQGFLEDIAPYLEQSSVIGKEDFLSNVLGSAVIDDHLMAIPRQFCVYTVVGRASDVGANPGWTLEEFMTLAESRPGTQILKKSGKDNLLSFCIRYNLDAFVDWERGKCSFNSPEFIRLLEFADRFGDVTANGDDSNLEKLQRGDILLNEAYVSRFDWLQYEREAFEGNPSVVGYPTVNGAQADYIAISGMCGIAANSRHKEGAWRFLEFYATTKSKLDDNDFLAVKSCLEQQMQEKLDDMAYQTDENGVIVVDENGERIPVPRITRVDVWGNMRFEYRTPTKEEAERTLELIRAAQMEPVKATEIQTIIHEEVGAFFYGSKSASQVADVIQNRVQLYLYEK